MTSNASSLVAGAKQWASNYGNYANGVEGAVLTAALRARAAWDANDADAFADLFIDNGSMLVGDNQLMSRDEIRTYMTDAFGGDYKGTKITGEPQEIKLLSDTVAVAITGGGVVAPGKTEIVPEAEVRTMWVIVKVDGDWRIASYQTSPVKG